MGKEVVETSQGVDWSALVFGGEWLKQLDRTAKRRFGQVVLAEEAVNYALEQLSANDWQKLGKFAGKSPPLHYLNSITANLIEEFSRKRFGRPRPPVWLKQNGQIWVGIWQHLCLERQPEQVVIDRWQNESRQTGFIKSIIQTVRSRMPWCGVKHEEIPASYVDHEDAASIFDQLTVDGPDAQQQEQGLEMLLLMLRGMIDTQYQATLIRHIDLDQNGAAKVSQLMDRLHEKLALSVQETLILKLIYLEGFKQSQVAEALAVPAYQLNRQIKSLLNRLQNTLAAFGDPAQWFTD